MRLPAPALTTLAAERMCRDRRSSRPAPAKATLTKVTTATKATDTITSTAPGGASAMTWNACAIGRSL